MWWRQGTLHRVVPRSFRPGGCPFDDDGGQLQAGLDGVDGVEERFLVLLQIAVIRQGQPLDQNE